MTVFKLQFVVDYAPRGESKSFKAGEVITVDNEASLNHYLNRGVAKLHKKEEAPKAASKKSTKKVKS